MKFLTSFAIAGLYGLAAEAAQKAGADVFLFRSQQQSHTEHPRLPKEVARHIFLQRTSRSRYGSDLRDIPNTIDTETAVEYIARYGKSPAPLFEQSETVEPSQLVVILEGVSPDAASQIKETVGQAGQKVAFTISDPPSATANNRLLKFFRSLGIASQKQCDLAAVINPFDSNCWAGTSLAVSYDASKSPRTLQALADNIDRINKFVADGELEVVLVVMPASSRVSTLSHWSAAASSTSASDLRRRDAEAETVIADDTVFTTKAPSALRAGNAGSKTVMERKVIPQCFTSFNSCDTATKSCTGHGECMNKYAEEDEPKCFSCVCKATILKPGVGEEHKGRQTIHWGGNMCQKEDISVPFWLITGFTITIIGAISFAIGLLFNVGEQKLPGVIGAGVSRSK